jgi:hypothetical protein
MAICKDPSLTYLNGLGYNVVRLPRAGIGPLDVLGREERRIERLGTLSQIWDSPLPPPAMGPPRPAADINGKRTDDLRLSIGLKILEGILAGMGAALPQLGFAYQRARSVQFSFSGVEAVSVDPFELGRHLAAGDLDIRNPFAAHYFEDEDCEAFVITEVLRSRVFSLSAKDERGAEVSVDVPAVRQAVGAKVSVTAGETGATGLTFKGPEPLAFGFKAFAIDYVDGAWRVRGVAPGGGMAFAVPDPSGKEPPVLTGILLSQSGRVAVRYGAGVP